MTTPNPLSEPLTPEDLLAEAQEHLSLLCGWLYRHNSKTCKQPPYMDAVAFLKRLDWEHEE